MSLGFRLGLALQLGLGVGARLGLGLGTFSKFDFYGSGF